MKLWRYGRVIETLGQRYRLDGMLGSGGMADVCLAWDEREQREVAIKVLKPGELEQKALDRFQKEAAQVARWRHPNILRFYGEVRLELLDAAQGSIVPYIVMEYAPGGDLDKRLRRDQPYPFAQTLIVFSQLCRAVAYAHEHGVIHRDLKPMNILFRQHADGTEQVVLSDFGLAVEVEASHFTYAGAGTLPYMAPEQLRGHAQPASDIFALGVILYQLCTGQLPFKRTLQDLGRRRPLPEPVAPSSLNPQLPPELDTVILNALSNDPAARYPDAMQFWQSVQDVIDMDTFKNVQLLAPNDSLFTSSAPQFSAPFSQPASPSRPRSNSPSQDVQTRFIASAPFSQLASAPASSGNSLPKNVQSRFSSPTTSGPKALELTQSRAIELPDSYERDTGPYARPVRPLPTQRPPSTPYANLANRPHRLPHWLLISSMFLLGLLIIGVVTAYTVPSLSNPLRSILPGVAPAASVIPATITITPASQLVQASYTLQAVSTTPDPAQNQIALRTVTFKTPDQTKPVTGTGKTMTLGLQAKGKIHFSNGDSNSYTVVAGTVFHATGGVDVTNNDLTIVPAATIVNGNIVPGTMDDDATAVQPGTNGDIAAGAVNLFPCCKSIAVSALSTVFTGGQDPQNYTFIQNSDVSSVVDPLKAQLLASSQKGVRDQIKTNEQMVGDITCNLTKSVDQHVGSDTGGQSIPSANVILAETCTVQVYDQSGPSGEQALVRTLLMQKASSMLGSNYALVGSIQLNPGTLTVSMDNLNMVVSSKGVWVYQFTDAQRQNLLKHIAGKTFADVRTYLKSQPGVSAAKIDISNGGTSLPTDTTQITLTIQAISGA